jgi:nitroreductase
MSFLCDLCELRGSLKEETMNVSEAIRLKRAVRNFQDKPLTEDVIRAILNAGRRAQSSKNTQPWHFIAIQDKAILKALSECGTWAGYTLCSLLNC